ncbi:aquaporin family protein [Parapedobacter sp. ISTM3]|uniref:Glycerol uptake facilitator protein n=1 Tax=Parapedobacter luteus TaxID=623280 RepID=A0A1T5EY95_9SPHI|nr:MULTISPECIES: MIP/aquaporin family protein [Parapedobacter]MBK1441497.1 aquaporin family protein [Parapedobacter sp. ISTM3]SKB88912.1 glycerol uptake facilitator protein [Parapedobacter luteus]
MTPFIAEVIGTGILILLGGGVVANVVLNGTKGHNSGWIVITTAWALAVFAGVVIAAPYSGAHLNPAVTLAMFIAGNIDAASSVLYVAGQFIGAMAGAFIVWLVYQDHFRITENPGAKQAVFCTAPAIRNLPVNLIGEAVGTFVLILTIFYFTDAELTDERAIPIGLGSLGALPVAFLVWVIGLSLGGTTGYAINPARDLGPRIVHALLPIKNKARFDASYAWVPVIGPLIGATLATAIFLWLGTA